MNSKIYAYGVSAIHVTGQQVHIDLVTARPRVKRRQRPPVFDVSKKIIMPLEGFMQLLAVQEDIVSQLAEAGLLNEAGTARSRPMYADAAD